MPDLTDADLSRLVTHVVIHEGTNPHLLHLDTFHRLERAGLVTAEYSIEDSDLPIDFTITADGAEVVNAMLAAGRMAIDK